MAALLGPGQSPNSAPLTLQWLHTTRRRASHGVITWTAEQFGTGVKKHDDEHKVPVWHLTDPLKFLDGTYWLQ